MNKKGLKLVVVGGVGGGAAFAARARRLSETSKIVLVERGPAASVAYCGMPYFIGGEIAKREDLFVTPESQLRIRYNMDLRLNSQVEKINREKKSVLIKNVKTGEQYEEDYDKLVLAMGAEALKLPIKGIESTSRCFALRSVDDMDKIKQYVKKDGSITIIGGGYTGIELAEQLTKVGMKVTLVELMDQILPYMDREMVVPLMNAMKKHGVNLKLKTSCTNMQEENNQVTVTLTDGTSITSDLVVSAAGVRPESKIAKEAGIACDDRRGGVLVNKHMQTNDPDVYAVGDLVMVKDVVLKCDAHIPLASPAAREGRIAANHIFNRQPDSFRGAQGTSILSAFGVTVSSTGAAEKMLQRMNIPFKKAYTFAGDHAGYYPGAQRMCLKIIYAPDTGKILGGQACGGVRGVDPRIDALSVAIQGGLTVYDLEETEMVYSPQYGSAKDPVNMLGFIAAGELRGDQNLVQLDQIMGNEDKYILVDVRTPAEVANGMLKGAKHMPLDELRKRHGELNLPMDSDKPIAVYCRIGARGYMGALILQALGYKNVKNISGGYELLSNNYTSM